MKHLRSFLITTAAAALLACSGCAGGSHEPAMVAWDDVPAAVQKTVKDHTAGYKVKKVEKEMEDGKVVYEAKAVRTSGWRRVIKVDENGNLIRVIKKSPETAVSWKHVPKAVQKTMTDSANGKKIDKVEQETVDGAVVYEGKVMNDDGSHLVIKVGKDGTLISSKVWKDKD